MKEGKAITIIGGGLAGLTLGIGLRQRDVPVAIYEAGRYPRHRVCGEFISGRGQAVLERLGLTEVLVNAGAIPARTVRFFAGQAQSPVRELTPAAVSVSRWGLDAVLARAFRERGGELREGTRWVGGDEDEGLVYASGRRLQAVEDGWRWFGVKAHARGVELSADLEMHSLAHGYVGVSRLRGGEVNVCGLFRRRVNGHETVPAREELLRGVANSSLHERLAEAEFDQDSLCSVAGLSLRPCRATARTDCCVGDALTMTPPVTGNGMSMAFEAAELATGPLVRYSRGECDWSEARQAVARGCDNAFGPRLRWARWLQWLMFSPALNGMVEARVLGCEAVWERMFRGTR